MIVRIVCKESKTYQLWELCQQEIRVKHEDLRLYSISILFSYLEKICFFDYGLKEKIRKCSREIMFCVLGFKNPIVEKNLETIDFVLNVCSFQIQFTKPFVTTIQHENSKFKLNYYHLILDNLILFVPFSNKRITNIQVKMQMFCVK